MLEEQKLDDLMEVLDEQEKKPYETAVVGTGQFGSDGGGIEISVNGVVHDCFYANGADEITFSDNARVIREGAVASVGDIHDIGFYCGTLRIPANIEEIEPGAFSSLESVDQVVVDPENPNYKVIDDVIFTKDGKTLIYCPANKRGSYEVPEGTEKIVHMAFYYGGVNSITIPESVTEIEFLAFFESDLGEIRGVAGSYAEEYADKEGLLFVDVDEEYARRFFERIKKAYCKKRITDFELWKAQQSQLTIERLKEYQTELTANMLIMGILKYDEVPSGRELENVDMATLRKHLRSDKLLPEDFEFECAKLRRYSHWEGDMFFIDYHLLRKYLFQHFGELTNEQHIAMFEYDVQMKHIHEEMERLTQKPTQQPTPDPSQRGGEERLLPPELSSRRARRILDRAVEAQLLTSDYQRPTDAEWWKMACMADVIGEELSLSNKWVVFCSLWGNSNLRKYNTDKQGMTDYNNFRKILRSQIL